MARVFCPDGEVCYRYSASIRSGSGSDGCHRGCDRGLRDEDWEDVKEEDDE